LKPTSAQPGIAAVLGVAAALFLVQLAAFHDLRHDDAFITFRYGQNLATGHGFVFNPGERLMGSTSPLFAIASGIVYALAGKQALPSIMSGVGCLAWVAQAVAVYRLLLAALGPRWAGGIALAIGVGGAGSAQWVALETNAAVAFVLWAVVFAREHRFEWAAALAALGGLVRPDAYLVGAMLAGIAIFELRSRVWRPAGVFLAISLPWLFFATAYFGSPLPQSAVAKYAQVSFSEYFVHALETPAETVAFGLQSPLLVLAVWALAFWGGAFLVRADRRHWLLVAYGLGHLLAYCVLRPFTQHTWHLYPLTLVLVVFTLCGVAGVARTMPQHSIRWSAACLLALFVAGHALRTTALAQSHTREYWNGARDAAYRMTAEYLDQNAKPGDVIATGEVGTLAYYSERSIYDLSGLVTADPEPIANLSAIPGLRFFLTNARFPKLPAEVRPRQILEARGFEVAVYRFDPAG